MNKFQIGDIVEVVKLNSTWDSHTNIEVGWLAEVVGVWEHATSKNIFGCDVIFIDWELEIDEDEVELNDDGSWQMLEFQLQLVERRI